jgi:hypothetical protein
VRVVSTHDEHELPRLREPRTDLVVERAVGDDRFEAATGPFSSYERTLHVHGGAHHGARWCRRRSDQR